MEEIRLQNIWISRSISFPDRSFEELGLPLPTRKLVWKCGNSRENVFDIHGDSSENWLEILAVVIMLSPYAQSYLLRLHPKTLIEIAMVLSTNSGSFPSNSHVSARPISFAWGCTRKSAQPTGVVYMNAPDCNTLQHTATHCNTHLTQPSGVVYICKSESLLAKVLSCRSFLAKEPLIAKNDLQLKRISTRKSHSRKSLAKVTRESQRIC